MTLQQLIDLSQIRELDSAALARLEQARQRQRDYDKEIEKQVANKAVSHALLAKTCNL
jgi:ABC-type transporter Mla MlaB component